MQFLRSVSQKKIYFMLLDILGNTLSRWKSEPLIFVRYKYEATANSQFA